MSQQDGGPAFPQHLVETRDGALVASYDAPDGVGMSLRDYFAAKAFPSVYEAYLEQNRAGCAEEHTLRNVPALVYKLADTMLKERAK